MAVFVDEIKIYAKAGDGGQGVTRWRHLKFQPKAGPAGGNGGRGGNVIVKAVNDLNILSKYTGDKKFIAADGEPGRSDSQHGKAGEDRVISVPIGSTLTNLLTGQKYELLELGQTQKILTGGQGGLGNEYFKSSTNVSPEEFTFGKPGEEADFLIELSIIADVGLVGMPNAGKSTLIQLLTNSKSEIGSYAFTTLEPHLGKFFDYTIADIPGLIEGAHAGKGLGHKFLRHISRTKTLLHLVSLEGDDPIGDLNVIERELANYDKSLTSKQRIIILTKKDLVNQDKIDTVLKSLDRTENRVFVLSLFDHEEVKKLSDALAASLAKG